MDRRHLRPAARFAEAEPVEPPPAEGDVSARPELSAPASAVAVGDASAFREAEPLDRALAEAPALTPVSVVIVSYNCKLPLLDCLDSLEAERSEVPLDVVLVDNDSTDDTAYEVASRFPWVQLIVNRTNMGFARAVNEGMRFTSGEYVLVLNPDTVVPPGTIARAVGELERRPEVGMLGCKLMRPDGTFDHACKRGFPTVMSALYYFTGLARAFPRSARFAQYTAAHLAIDETGPVDSVNGAFMLVRRSAAEEVGELDERYWLWAEDLDWCHRFWERGWQVLYWPGAEVVHLKGASVGDHRSFRLNFAFHRSIWLFYAKHHAPQRSALVSVLVWLGLWSKFAGSAIANAVRTRASGRRA
jgi:GT2 family glycosyltransferase